MDSTLIPSPSFPSPLFHPPPLFWKTIVDSLTSISPSLVREVQTLITELCRVTLLWEEMWLATLMQRQGELYR